MPANFIIPLSKQNYTELMNDSSEWVAAAKNDPLFVFDDTGSKIEIHGEYREIALGVPRRRFRDMIEARLSAKDKVLKGAEATVEKFGTPAYKTLTRNRRDQARAALANVAPPLTGAPPAVAHGVTGDMAATDAAKHRLGAGGLVMGYDHKDQTSKDFTTEFIQKSGGTELKHLFVEELSSDLQSEIDHFLSSPVAEMKPALLSRIRDLQTGSTSADFEPMLYAAREKGVKVWGIDTAKADPQVDTSDPRYHERRLALMNAEAKTVFDHVRRTFPNEPFMALTGNMHVNTADGGIPGLAQIMGVPGFCLESGSDRLAFVPEDTSKRAAVSPLERECAEAILKKAGKDYATYRDHFKTTKAYTGLEDPKPSLDSKLNLPEVTVIAQRLAAQFTSSGKLGKPADIAGLLSDATVKNALDTLFKAVVLRGARTKALKKRLAVAI